MLRKTKALVAPGVVVIGGEADDPTPDREPRAAAPRKADSDLFSGIMKIEVAGRSVNVSRSGVQAIERVTSQAADG